MFKVKVQGPKADFPATSFLAVSQSILTDIYGSPQFDWHVHKVTVLEPHFLGRARYKGIEFEIEADILGAEGVSNGSLAAFKANARRKLADGLHAVPPTLGRKDLFAQWSLLPNE